MATIVFGIRGSIRDQEWFIDWMKTRVHPLPVKTKDGKEVQQFFTGLVQPIQFMSYTCPKDEVDSVMNGLCFEEMEQRWKDNMKTKAAKTVIRKAMGLKKIPKYKKDKQLAMPRGMLKNIALYPIGWKEDITHTDDKGDTYEAL